MVKKWVIESYLGGGKNMHRIPLTKFPAQVGRSLEIAIPIVKPEISRVHAEFIEKNGELILRDLNSKNGSFVNHQKLIGEMALRHGDIVHFAKYEARVVQENRDTEILDCEVTQFSAGPLSSKLPAGLNELQLLLSARAIQAEFQPIVDIKGNLFAYEVLGRGGRDDLPKHPEGLFRIAESMPGKASELSLLMRDCGAEQGYTQSNTQLLFLNTHPAELHDINYLLKTMQRLRDAHEDLPMVLEIHEDAVTNVVKLKQFANELSALDIDLAYDDFGAGQARLMEIAEVSVKYVKFDIALIRGLHQAPEAKQRMVAALASMTQALGIQVLAEGVECAEELILCKQMNFDLIQGYYFGRPRPKMNYINPLL